MHDEEDYMNNNSDNSIHNSMFDTMFNLKVHCMCSIVCARVKRILTGDGTKASLYFLGFILSTPLKRMTFKYLKYANCLNGCPF